MCCNFTCKSLLSVSVSCRLVTSSCIHLFSSTLLLTRRVFFAALWLALYGPLRTDVCYLHLSVRAHRRCLWMLSWTFCLCFWPKCWTCCDHACSPPDRITPPVPSAEPTWLTEAPWHPPTSDPLRDTAWHCSWMKDDSSPHSSSFLYFYLTVFSPYSTNSSGIEPWSCYRFTLVLRGRRSSLLFNEPEINCKIFPCMFVSFVKNRMI